jgi:cytochrome c oxidase assembly protein subunit 15
MESHRGFRIFAGITLAAVYFLVLVGASVRATGAGMGCPDWPMCFGQLIPPTDVSQLPANYQEIYADRGYDEMEFNVVKTWTEYVNRLIGSVVGLLVFTTFVWSLRLRREGLLIPALGFTALFFTGLAGWLGKVVVEGNLDPITITMHMVSALAIVASLVWLTAHLQRSGFAVLSAEGLRLARWAVVICLVLSLVQIFMGSQVRQSMDGIAEQLGETQRKVWTMNLGTLFYVHRSFSFAIVAANIFLAVQILRHGRGVPALVRTAQSLIAIIVVEIATGAALYYLGFPAYLQPAHLLLATLMFGAQLFIWVACRSPKNVVALGTEIG